MPINKITNAVYQSKLDEYGQARTKESTRKFHHQLKACLQYAFRNGVIQIDPSYEVKISAKRE